jgi:hypothetical protein
MAEMNGKQHGTLNEWKLTAGRFIAGEARCRFSRSNPGASAARRAIDQIITHRLACECVFSARIPSRRVMHQAKSQNPARRRTLPAAFRDKWCPESLSQRPASAHAVRKRDRPAGSPGVDTNMQELKSVLMCSRPAGGEARVQPAAHKSAT